jgi:phosphatidylserine/phosphatidylglycerophosphate/cardiolipin synthase-like enzyme
LVENRFTTHKEHEDLLISALENSEFRVLITSPYLSIARIDDRLENAFKSATTRDVKVVIVYNEEMNKKLGEINENCSAAIDKLKECGCYVKNHPQFHNKTLAIDSNDLIDGSYNWLSAVLNRESRFHNREVSQRYLSDQIADVIQHEWHEYKVEDL